MDNILKHAVIAGLKQGLNPVSPGEYDFDETVTLNVKGTVVKNEPGEYTPTADIPLLATMALFLEKAGFQRELAKRLLTEAMLEALDENIQASDYVAERVKDIEAAMVHVQDIVGKLPKRTRQGGTFVNVEVNELIPA